METESIRNGKELKVGGCDSHVGQVLTSNFRISSEDTLRKRFPDPEYHAEEPSCAKRSMPLDHTGNVIRSNHLKEAKMSEDDLELQDVQKMLTWLASCFMDNDEISDIILSTCFNDLFDDMVSSVDSLCVGEDEFHFL